MVDLNKKTNENPYHVTASKIMFCGDPKMDAIVELVAKTNSAPAGFVTSGLYGGADRAIASISTAVGCPMKCGMCEMGTEKYVRPLQSKEISGLLRMTLDYAKIFTANIKNLKVSMAKSGDMLLNPYAVDAMVQIGKEFDCSFKASTVFPAAKVAGKNFMKLTHFAETHEKPVQLQMSLLSTDDKYRSELTGGGVSSIKQIRPLVGYWHKNNPDGRIPNAVLIVSKETPADPKQIIDILPPGSVNIRLREYVETANGKNIELHPVTAGELQEIYEKFKDCGYNVSTAGTPSPMEKKFGISSNAIWDMFPLHVDGTLKKEQNKGQHKE